MIVSKVKPVLTAILPRLGRVKRWVYLFLIYEYQIHPAKALIQQVNSKVWLRRDWNWMSEVSNSWHIRGSQKSESGLKCYRTPRVLGWKCNKLQVQKGKVHLKKKKRREQKPSKRLGVNSRIKRGGKQREMGDFWERNWMVTLSGCWASSVDDLESRQESGLVWERKAQKQGFCELCNSQS